MRLLVASLIVIGLLAAARQGGAAPALSALTVQATDLPAASLLITEQHETPEQYATDYSMPLATVRRLGVLRGNVRLFLLPFKAKQKIVSQLAAQVVLFSSGAAAHLRYSQLAQLELAGMNATDKRLAIGTLGNEHLVVAGTLNQAKPAVPAAAALFRRGRYEVTLLLTDPSKQFTTTQFMHLAKIVDARIQHAH